MLRKVNKIFIGKTARTVALVDGVDITTVQSNIVEGELVVLDSNFNVVEGASATYANTKTIYIAEGSSEIFESTNPDDTPLSGRRLILSDPIDGSHVVNYIGSTYAAKAEATSTIPSISDTIIAGTEYVLRIVFTGDVAAQVPGQNTETHRYIAKAGDTSDDVYNGLIKSINRRSHSRGIQRGRLSLVDAVLSTGSLVLTAKPIRSCTTSVNDIDELVMNGFKVFLNYVDNDGFWTEVGLSADVTSTASSRGIGTWETVRDAEKHAQAYRGVSNYTWFPVIRPAMRVEKDAEYNLIVIEHDKQYRSPDNQYNKETSLVTQLCFDTATAGAIQAEILGTLNTWMASIPKAQDAVTL